MRTARLVGLSPDGASVIVATDSGEEWAIPVDESMRAALRGDRPRLGQLEVQMESSLSPRDIQSRIRGGATLDEVAQFAGIPIDRVERFAAPVLAEREHIATQAMSAMVRRKGETSGHRSLRVTVTERLLARGIDVDSIDWDSSRIEGGRWTVSCDYRSGESVHQAAFVFDLSGRFSVAANDEARWLLGEHSHSRGPQPGRRRPGGSDQQRVTDDSEPTLDLSDELALVRATQEDTEPSPARPAVSVVPDIEPSSERASDEEATDADRGAEEESPETDPVRGPGGLTDATAVPDTSAAGDWEPAVVGKYPIEPSLLGDDDPEPSLLGDDDPEPSLLGDDDPEPSSLGHDGEDAEPAPQTPGDTASAGSDEPGRADPPTETHTREAEAVALELEFAESAPSQAQGSAAATQGAESPAEESPGVDTTQDAEAESADPEATEPAVPVKRPARKKRASVPSWDEIMFGGPKKS